MKRTQTVFQAKESPKPMPTEEIKTALKSDMEKSVEALSTITERLRKGSTISEVQTAFEAHEFPALERKTSQMALFAAVERSKKEAINVQEMITQEEDKDTNVTDIPKQENRKKSLAKIGLTAFMTAAIKEPERADEIISSLHLDDFAEAQAEKQYARMILQSTELDVAQVLYSMLMRNDIKMSNNSLTNNFAECYLSSLGLGSYY